MDMHDVCVLYAHTHTHKLIECAHGKQSKAME